MYMCVCVRQRVSDQPGTWSLPTGSKPKILIHVLACMHVSAPCVCELVAIPVLLCVCVFMGIALCVSICMHV